MLRKRLGVKTSSPICHGKTCRSNLLSCAEVNAGVGARDATSFRRGLKSYARP